MGRARADRAASNRNVVVVVVVDEEADAWALAMVQGLGSLPRWLALGGQRRGGGGWQAQAQAQPRERGGFPVGEQQREQGREMGAWCMAASRAMSLG